MKLQKLTDKIERLFNISELRDLCFRLSVEYDDLSGENRKDKVRELVQFCNRRGKIDELMHLCRLLRPNESWDSEPFKVAQSGRQYIRTVALAAAKHEVDKFVSDHPDFHVLVNSQNTPTEYIFRFKASSVAPPLDEHSDPVPIFEHKVHFFLPPDYPKRPPEIHWLSPIYHCNIDPESGKLGIGILEENYLPNLGLGRFCKMIVEIASFHNYEFTHSKNAQAKKWLNSPKGQEAIREIGGYQLHERLNSESEDLHPRMHELNKRLLHQSNQNHSKMSPLEIQERLKNQKLVEYAIRLIPKADYHKEGLIGKDERSYVFIGDYYEQRSRSLREILANLWIGDAFDKVANANTEWLGIIFEVGELNYRKFDLMPATWKSMFRNPNGSLMGPWRPWDLWAQCTRIAWKGGQAGQAGGTGMMGGRDGAAGQSITVLGW